MKVAVSIPTPLFEKAEKEVSRRRWSRSRLYAAALEAFLRQKEADRVTEALNAVYSTEDSRLPQDLARAQARTLDDSRW